MPYFLLQGDTNVSPIAGAPWWAQMLFMLLSMVITAFLLPWLRSKAESERAKKASILIDANASAVSMFAVIRAELMEALYDGAASIAESEYPEIAKRVLNGELKTQEQVKAVLQSLGGRLKAHVVKSFGNRGIDLIALYGDGALDRLIETAVNKISPFPGMETAAELLKTDISNKLVEKGVKYLREWYEASAASTIKASTGVETKPQDVQLTQ